MQIIAWSESITGISLIRTVAIMDNARILAEKGFSRSMLFLAMKCLTTDRWFADHRVEPDITWIVRRQSTCMKYIENHIHELPPEETPTPPEKQESALPSPSFSTSSSVSSIPADVRSLIRQKYTYATLAEPMDDELQYYTDLPEAVLQGWESPDKIAHHSFPDFAIALFPQWMLTLIATGEMTIVTNEGIEETTSILEEKREEEGVAV